MKTVVAFDRKLPLSLMDGKTTALKSRDESTASGKMTMCDALRPACNTVDLKSHFVAEPSASLSFRHEMFCD